MKTSVKDETTGGNEQKESGPGEQNFTIHVTNYNCQ